MRIGVLKCLHHAGQRHFLLVIEHRTGVMGLDGNAGNGHGSERKHDHDRLHFFPAFLTAASLLTSPSFGTKSKSGNWLVPASVVMIELFGFSRQSQYLMRSWLSS